MNDTSSTSKANKVNGNGTAELKLKQARLTFFTNSRKSETSKKRKLEDDTDHKNKSPEAVYIDLSDSNDGTKHLTENSDLKNSKVCIIEKDSKHETSNSDKSDENNIKKRNSLQEWVKPKKAKVTKTNDDCDINKKLNISGTAELQVVEPMEIDNENQNEEVNDSAIDEKLNNSLINASDDNLVNTSFECSVTESVKSSNSCPTTPTTKQQKTHELPVTPTTGLMIRKKLTPKQIQKQAELEMKKEEKQKLKEEREKKRQEEKEEKQKLKDEKEKKRLAEIEAKNEEKKQKEEEKKRLKEQKEEERKRQKEQKEEERKQKEEEKRQREEQERKKKEKTAAAFTNFFLSKNKEPAKDTTENVVKNNDTMFMPFEIKTNMRLAEIKRVNLTEERLRTLDEILQNVKEFDKSSLYITQLKSKDYKIGHSDNTWPLNVADEDDDIMIVDEESAAEAIPGNGKPLRYHCKLLQFHENRRPAYWGTWRKKSKNITGRKPFNQDAIFDYEVDSDEEWEDEPGESLNGSDDEKESEDDYEVDNDVFVPHGYLSDEEAQNDDAQGSSPKSNKLKLNILERLFEEEMSEKTHKLKPRVFGCIWINNSIKKNETVNNVENLLLNFRAVFKEDRTPFVIRLLTDDITPQNTPSLKIRLKNEFPETYLPDLVKLVHGNKRNSQLIAKEFAAYISNKDSTINLTISCIIKKVKEISSWVSIQGCRVVNDDIKNQYNLSDSSHQENTWKYITICDDQIIDKSHKEDKQPVTPVPGAVPPTIFSSKINPSSITKFVKVLTAEEKEKVFNEIKNEKILEKSENPPSIKKKKGAITKFVKVLNLTEKKSLSSMSSSGDVIDLVDDHDDITVPLISGSKLDVENKIKPDPDKFVNILVPKKASKTESKSVNVLIPKKTPSTPTAKSSTNANVNILTRKGEKELETESNADAKDTKPVNISIAGRASETSTSFASKPVNILIPRKTPNVPKIKEGIANSKPVDALVHKATESVNGSKENNNLAKPVNILIPRRARDKKKETKEKSETSEKTNGELIKNTKDLMEDSSSVDFTLSIDSNDGSKAEKQDAENK